MLKKVKDINIYKLKFLMEVQGTFHDIDRLLNRESSFAPDVYESNPEVSYCSDPHEYRILSAT